MHELGIVFYMVDLLGETARENGLSRIAKVSVSLGEVSGVLTDYFDRMKTAGIDYDIIGLSYYPEHHGNLTTLETALTSLENKNYGKDIWIVETGYSYAWSIGGTFDYQSTYPYTEEGQRQFTADLITKLNAHSSVKGLFWWWPEDNGNKQVTNSWWNAALYNHNTGKPYAALYELKNFMDGNSGIVSLTQSLSKGEGAWYTLDGRRFTNKPTARGYYINNGKTVVVK